MTKIIELFCLLSPIACIIWAINCTPNHSPLVNPVAAVDVEVRIEDYSGDYDCSELSEFTGKNECAVLGIDNLTGEEI